MNNLHHIVLIALGLLGLTGNLHADTTIFSDGFESGDTSAWIANGTNPKLEPVNTFNHGGNFSAYAPTTLTGTGFLEKKFTAISSGKIKTSIWIMPAAAAGIADTSFWMGDMAFDIYGADGTSYPLTPFAVGSSGAQTYEYNLVSIEKGSWHQLSLEYDFDNAVTTFYVDGIKIHEYSIQISSIGMIGFRSNEANVYFDDILVTHTSTSIATPTATPTPTPTPSPIQAQTIGAISFSPTTLIVGGTTMVGATASSGLTVNFSSLTPDFCTVSANIVTGIAEGTCTIAANQIGDDYYSEAAQVTQDITIGAAEVAEPISTARLFKFAEANYSLLFNGTPTDDVYGQYIFRYYPETGNYLAVSSSGEIYTLGEFTDNVIILLGTIEYVRPGITAWEATATAQTIGAITFLTAGGTTTASATASSGLAVSFSSATPTVCSVSGNTVTRVATGTCTIAADQAGSADYFTAPQVTAMLVVTLNERLFAYWEANFSSRFSGVSVPGIIGPYSVRFYPGSQNYLGIDASGEFFTYEQTVLTSVGMVSAYEPDIIAWEATAKNQTIGAITFSPATPTVDGWTMDGWTTASATASSGLAVSFSSSAPTVCSVSGTNVIGVATGTCTITAGQAGSAGYFAAPQVTTSMQVLATPAGYVFHDGLIWMPVTFQDTWTNAKNYCANTLILGLKGWRMPSLLELSRLWVSGAHYGQAGWTGGLVWTSMDSSSTQILDNPLRTYRFAVDLTNGKDGMVDEMYPLFVSCVRGYL